MLVPNKPHAIRSFKHGSYEASYWRKLCRASASPAVGEAVTGEQRHTALLCLGIQRLSLGGPQTPDRGA